MYLPAYCCIGIEVHTSPNDFAKRAHLQGRCMLRCPIVSCNQLKTSPGGYAKKRPSRHLAIAENIACITDLGHSPSRVGDC